MKSSRKIPKFSHFFQNQLTKYDSTNTPSLAPGSMTLGNYNCAVNPLLEVPYVFITGLWREKSFDIEEGISEYYYFVDHRMFCRRFVTLTVNFA